MMVSDVFLLVVVKIGIYRKSPHHRKVKKPPSLTKAAFYFVLKKRRKFYLNALIPVTSIPVINRCIS